VSRGVDGMVTSAALIALLAEGEQWCQPDDMLRMRTEVRELFSRHSAHSAQSMRLSDLAARCGGCSFVVHLQTMQREVRRQRAAVCIQRAYRGCLGRRAYPLRRETPWWHHGGLQHDSPLPSEDSQRTHPTAEVRSDGPSVSSLSDDPPRGAEGCPESSSSTTPVSQQSCHPPWWQAVRDGLWSEEQLEVNPRLRLPKLRKLRERLTLHLDADAGMDGLTPFLSLPEEAFASAVQHSRQPEFSATLQPHASLEGFGL
jgi:hypothetical protein